MPDSRPSRHSSGPLPCHIVWDWNGTLQDDVRAAVNGINILLARRGLPLVDIARHRELFAFPVRRYYVALGFHLENEDWDAMSHEFITAFLADPSTRLRPETPDVLSRFRKAGVGMSLLSAAETPTLERLLSSYGIRRYFDHVCGLDNPGAAGKLAIGKSLMAGLSCDSSQVWFIGDTDHDFEVARAFGANCLLLANGYQSAERLAACGCPVVSGLSDAPSFFGL